VTRVQFYHNARNPLALTCELVGKAHQGGHKAIIISPDAALAQRLDQQLWTATPGNFIPHVLSSSPLAAETPVIIAIAGDATGENWPHTDLLFNLGGRIPSACERFNLVIEIVGPDEAERLSARSRWMHYKQQQFPLKAFDAELRSAL
jgi:DNA polymerase-3 subunit chi